MSKNTAPTLQKLKDEQARLRPLEARANELRDAIARLKAEIAELGEAIRRPHEADAREHVRALALGGAPLDNIEAPQYLAEQRRQALRQRCAEAEERCRILEAALQENALEQNAINGQVSVARGAHFGAVAADIFRSDAVQECRRLLGDLYAVAGWAGNTAAWPAWLELALADWPAPTDAEHAAALRRLVSE